MLYFNRLKVCGLFFFFFKENNTFVQQGCLELNKSDNKDISNVPKVFYSIRYGVSLAF